MKILAVIHLMIVGRHEIHSIHLIVVHVDNHQPTDMHHTKVSDKNNTTIQKWIITGNTKKKPLNTTKTKRIFICKW